MRVDLRAGCDEQALLSLSAPELVFSDCEGAEADIFTPRVVKHLSSSAVLVETHDTLDLMMKRFSDHSLAGTVRSGEHNADYPELGGWSSEDRRIAVSEFRSTEIVWALFLPSGSSL